MSKRIVVVLNDLHCGSIYGLLPPDFKQSTGAYIGQNSGQKYLWECWKFAANVINQLGAEVIVANGDLVDGKQEAQRGTELALPMIQDQARAAQMCLQMVRGKRWYFVAGTEYHDQKGAREVEAVAESLGARPYKGLGTGHYSKEVLDLSIDGVGLNFSHGTSVATGFYRATPADREGIWSALAGKEGKMPKADCVVRAHAHNFVHVEHASKHIVIAPCWQLQTRYMRKNSVYRMIPDIGFIWLEIDGKAKHGDRVIVRKCLFDLPPFEVEKI